MIKGSTYLRQVESKVNEQSAQWTAGMSVLGPQWHQTLTLQVYTGSTVSTLLFKVFEHYQANTYLHFWLQKATTAAMHL
jgi:hypothetical protein